MKRGFQRAFLLLWSSWGNFLCAGPAEASPREDLLTIDQAVEEALRNNLRLLAERANISIAEARVATARLRPNPLVSLGGDHLDLLGTGFNEANGGGPPEYSVRTDFTIERGGKRARRVEAAEYAREVAESEFGNQVRLLVLQVRQAALQLLLAKANLEVARENMGAANRIVQINELRFKAGDIAEVELMRSRVAALEAASYVRRSEAEVRLARERLRPLLGRSPGAPPVEIVGEIPRPTPPSSLEQLVEQAVRLRPDLAAMRFELQRANAELALQLAQAKVNYTLGSEYRRQQGINGKANTLGLFLTAEIPLFNRNQGEIERARQEVRQVEIRLRALELEIRSEVARIYEEWLAARDLVDVLERRMISEARQVRDVVEYSYRLGEATLLELLDAQRAFNQTRQLLNEARAQYARSLYELEAACGGAVSDSQ